MHHLSWCSDKFLSDITINIIIQGFNYGNHIQIFTYFYFALQYSEFLKPKPKLTSNSSSFQFPISVRGTIIILLAIPLDPHPQTLILVTNSTNTYTSLFLSDTHLLVCLKNSFIQIHLQATKLPFFMSVLKILQQLLLIKTYWSCSNIQGPSLLYSINNVPLNTGNNTSDFFPKHTPSSLL